MKTILARLALVLSLPLAACGGTSLDSSADLAGTWKLSAPGYCASGTITLAVNPHPALANRIGSWQCDGVAGTGSAGGALFTTGEVAIALQDLASLSGGSVFATMSDDGRTIAGTVSPYGKVGVPFTATRQ